MTNKLVLILLSIFIPPVAVFAKKGDFNKQVIISIILTLLGFVPGQIYALLISLDII
jgi:uncharacterized membrane protein YqaE (UPF0057 family)